MGGWLNIAGFDPFTIAMLKLQALRAELGTRAGFRSPAPHRHGAGTPVQPYRLGGVAYAANGKRERARRRRQIERGQLKAENGAGALVTPLRPPLQVTFGDPPELIIPDWPHKIDGYQRLDMVAGDVKFEGFDPAWPHLPVEGAGGIIVVEPPPARPPIVVWATSIAMLVLCAIAAATPLFIGG